MSDVVGKALRAVAMGTWLFGIDPAASTVMTSSLSLEKASAASDTFAAMMQGWELSKASPEMLKRVDAMKQGHRFELAIGNG